MKNILLLIAISFVAVTNCFGELIEKEKRINKRYNVSASDKLYIDNSYGKVDVHTWDRNEITVDVLITVKAKTQSKVQDKLDDISIEESAGAGKIIFKTRIMKDNVTITENSYMSIDYVINMPRRNALELVNKFGPATIDDFAGNLDVTVKYGAFKTGILTGSKKAIKVDFGSADIESIEQGELEISYSNLKIGKANTLEVTNKFGKTNINNIQFLSVTQRYGDLVVGNAGALTGSVEFANVKATEISKKCDMVLKYCSKADFGIIRSEADLVKVKGSFSTVYFDIANGASFDADIYTSFGAFKNRSGKISLYREDTDKYGHNEHYTGKIGRGAGKMQINLSYGDVVFR